MESSALRADAEPQFSFKRTIVNIKNVFANDEMDGTTKYNNLTQLIRHYFDSEEVRDVFEGFLRLLTICHEYATKLVGSNDASLAVQCLQVYVDFIAQKDEFDRDIIAESMPEQRDVYLKAIKVATTFKSKHLPKIASAFQLKNSKNTPILIKSVKHIMKKDFQRSIDWIIYFDLRDDFEFAFKEIVCQLFLLNLPSLLESFVGDARYRKLNLINYFDELFSLEMRKFKGRNDSEEYALAETKRLEKFATRYMKLYDIPESTAPNILNYRTRSALLYHHYRWVHGELQLINFEEIALHAMRDSIFVRRFYLDFLCANERALNALYFAFRLGMTAADFPPRLAEFARQNESDVEKTRAEALKDSETKIRLMEESFNEDCQLFNGFPVYYIVDWRGMKRLMKILLHEELIGIDTEWKPHYAHFKEQVALIQVACSRAVFLIDVVLLESRLSNEQWLQFFRALLCSEDCRKIGFDFANDLRVLLSSFPFLSLIAEDVKHVVCLYRLLQNVFLIPEAEKLVFPDDIQRLSHNRLYEVAKYFLHIELDKSEQNANWVERPMRMEKKIYAALDAFCLTGSFRIIAERLVRIDDPKIIKRLQEAALVNFVAQKHSLGTRRALSHKSGDEAAHPTAKLPAENDDEFYRTILNCSEELERNAAARPPHFRADFKSIDDFRFVMDSMLFGLGQKLRKCGFDTEMIGDREELARFCDANPGFTAVSTGKAFKKLELCLPPERLLCVPINTSDPTLNSELIAYIMRKLNIVIRAADLRTRCAKCNRRAFVRVARHVIRALFYLNAVERRLDFLNIGMTELRQVFDELLAHATVSALDAQLDEAGDEYTVMIEENQLTCRCQRCSIDVMNRLLLTDELMGAIELGGTINIPIGALDDPTSVYYACKFCGKIEYVWPNRAEKQAAADPTPTAAADGAETPAQETSARPIAATAGIRMRVVETA